jgi:hypothetical protein
VRLPFEGSAVLFRGMVHRLYGSGWYSATGWLLTMPHSVA